MEMLLLVALSLLILALREYQHDKAIARLSELHGQLANDLASRIVRPDLPVRPAPVDLGERPPAAVSESHLVGVVLPPDQDAA